MKPQDPADGRAGSDTGSDTGIKTGSETGSEESGQNSAARSCPDGSAAARGTPHRTSPAGTRIAHRRPCAVVVERDPDVARTLAAWLTPELDVQVASSAVRAAEVLEQLPFVDLAFVDLELPLNLGEELLQLLGRWPDAIRVLLWKQGAAATSTGQLELPRNRYLAHLVLAKPVSPGIVQALKCATLGLPRI
jgi:CheY-like chemotaxis protein